MAGRQPRLNKILINKICKSIEKGLSRKLACSINGVRESTLYYWLKDAEILNNALEKDISLTDPMIIDIGDNQVTITNGLCKLELLESIHKSESKYLATLVEALGTGVEAKDLPTIKWLLERRCREDYGLQSIVKVGNVQGETFKQEIHTKTIVEQLAELELELGDAVLGDPPRIEGDEDD